MNRTTILAACVVALVAAAAALILQDRGGGARVPIPTDDSLERRLAHLERVLEDLRATSPWMQGAAVVARDAAPVRSAVVESSRVEGSRPGELSPAGDELDDLRRRLDVLETLVTALQRDPVQRGFDYLASDNAELRRRGVDMLESIARVDPEARAAIRGMLRDSSPEVREQALDALEDIDDVAAIPLVQEMLADAAPDVRHEAVSALEGLLRQAPPGPEAARAAEALVRRVADADPRVREQAIGALGDLRSAAGTQALLRALDDPVAAVRDRAIDALGDICDAAALPRLRTLYQAGQGPQRLDVAIALSRLGDLGPFRQEAVRLVAAATSHEDERERARAIDTLGRVAPQEYEAVLTRALEDPSQRVRREAEQALRRLRGG